MGPDAAASLAPAVGAHGGTIQKLRPSFLNYAPGHDILVRYDATVVYGRAAREESVVAIARHHPPPSGAIESEAGGMPIGVWRFQDDPSLPGIALATDKAFVAGLLEEMGIDVARVNLDVRAYSPRSRCVVQVASRREDKLVFRPGRGIVKPPTDTVLYLKVRRPGRAAEVHRAHELLADRIRAPRALAYREKEGILALEPLPGDTLWDTVAHGLHRPPEPEELIGVLQGIEDVPLETEGRATTSETVPYNAAMLRAIVPERAEAIDRFLEAFGEDSPQPELTVHGDFHEVQVLVDENGISGVLDLDDTGRGQRMDDLAMMAGRLYCYSHTEPDKEGKVEAYTRRTIEAFSRHVDDPQDFHRRVAGVAMNHATGHFRFQDRAWRQETRKAIDRACALQAQLVTS